MNELQNNEITFEEIEVSENNEILDEKSGVPKGVIIGFGALAVGGLALYARKKIKNTINNLSIKHLTKQGYDVVKKESEFVEEFYEEEFEDCTEECK